MFRAKVDEGQARYLQKLSPEPEPICPIPYFPLGRLFSPSLRSGLWWGWMHTCSPRADTWLQATQCRAAYPGTQASQTKGTISSGLCAVRIWAQPLNTGMNLLSSAEGDAELRDRQRFDWWPLMNPHTDCPRPNPGSWGACRIEYLARAQILV